MTVLDELNREIWQPFRRTYGDRDLAGYLDLYDRDLIRAGGPAGEVYGYDHLAAETTGWFAKVAANGEHGPPVIRIGRPSHATAVFR